jgi:hypothetical protein
MPGFAIRAIQSGVGGCGWAATVLRRRVIDGTMGKSDVVPGTGKFDER